MAVGACLTRHRIGVVVAAIVVMFAPGLVAAQSTTASIQGTVSDETGVLPGATISARETEGGFSFEAVTGAEGAFVLAGLRPGTYELTVVMDKYKPQTQTVRVLVGQAVTANFRITPDLLFVEEVTVVGDRLVDTRTSEITTNVTEEQIRYLPQNSRNFLSFAQLAPGVRLSTDEFRQEVTSGGLASRSTNVFIDGVSYKNDVLEGGVIGQDASRGNPFPQNAVQEFQVLTQNFKAEYEKATSAIITAVTKSGTNRFSGHIFNFYQDKSLVENQAIVRDAATGLLVPGKADPKPVFERWQWGVSLGGPIVRDKTWFFGAFEENRQDRASQVFLGTVVGAPPPASLVESLRPFEGQFTSPFRERLLFGKGSWQPKPGQQVELTYNWRNETDIRGFGNQGANAQTSFEAAENIRNRVDSFMGKYQMAGASFVNETYGSYQRYRWNPSPQNPDLIGEDYQGLLKVGGRDTTQLMVQERYTFRDDYTRFAQWRGSHALKVGGVVSFLDYTVSKELFGNPLFRFRTNEGFAFPFEASYGVGNPDLSASNRQFGVYAQDDWAIAPRVTLNLGLRWDVETNMIDSSYVTPPEVIAAAASFVDASRYFTDGDDRSPFYGAVQPRVGLSWDVRGTGRTVVFGGYGRYYDRVLYDYGLDERSRLQYAVRLFRFSANGAPRDGNPTIAWNPAYLSEAGLENLIAQGVAPSVEVFLLDNELKPPRSDQYSVGVRHDVRGILVSASYAAVRARDEFTWIRANRRADGTCCLPVPGFANLFISTTKKSWFDGLFLQAEKPYGSRGSRWGVSGTYTLGRAEQNGGERFSLDFPTPADYGRYSTSSDERHRFVGTAIVGLPFDFLASTLVTLGSGLPYNIDDQLAGSGENEKILRRNAGRADMYQTVDFRLEKIFRFGSTQQASVAFEAFNLFSHDNFRDYDGLLPTPPAVNPNYGRPRAFIDPGRRLQFGLRYTF